MKIYEDVTKLIGNTPLISLARLSGKLGIDPPLIVKAELYNPLGSVKDRVGFYLVQQALQEGKLKKGGTVVEPTSGNTGIGLALGCIHFGLKLILTMPETMSKERRDMLYALGAEIVLTEGGKGMAGAVEKARSLLAEIPDSYMPQQFENPDNPAVHRQTTAREILRDTDGKIGAFVATVGTGGTVTGVGETLKEYDPNIQIVAVEPAASPLLSCGKAGPHKIQGIGANFVPKILNRGIIDRIERVENEEAYEYARLLARTEGIFAGISSGAALCAGAKLAKDPAFSGKTIVILLPDTGQRYLSTDLFSDK